MRHVARTARVEFDTPEERAAVRVSMGVRLLDTLEQERAYLGPVDRRYLRNLVVRDLAEMVGEMELEMPEADE